MKSLAIYGLSAGAAALITGCGASLSAAPPLPASSGLTTTSTAAPTETCATEPPQHEWIFKGACDKMVLTSYGGSFSLKTYQGITLFGTVGNTSAEKPSRVYVVDALDNGDIEKYNGKPFPKYVPYEGRTVFYAAAINQSSVAIKPVERQGYPVLQYTVRDYSQGGLPGDVCGAATLERYRGKWQWAEFPGTYRAHKHSVTITIYSAPSGFELPPKKPVYIALSCRVTAN